MIFGFYTLGCKVNQYETQAMEQMLRSRGHTVCSFSDDCDGYIINTCSVTAVADKKNRAILRRCRKAHPNAVIAVCGCYSQHAPEAVQDADVVGGSADRRWIRPSGAGNLRSCLPAVFPAAPGPC